MRIADAGNNLSFYNVRILYTILFSNFDFTDLNRILVYSLKLKLQMITIGKAQFDFDMENETFAQALYGGWEHFCSASFEKVLDEVLSRYDTSDELIQIETLTLELGTLTENEFYEHFPKVLADKLNETFSTYLKNKEIYPEQVTIIPIKRMLLNSFTFFLQHGYLSWSADNKTQDITRMLNEVIRENESELIVFLQTYGYKHSIRERLVFQFADKELESLISILVENESAFIKPYVRYLITSYKVIKRPEITASDFRNVVWYLVFSYILSESKGYFSRKQLVLYTMRELAKRYNMEFNLLLNLLTQGLERLLTQQLIVPGLLLILSEIRTEQQERTEFSALIAAMPANELIARLKDKDSCRKFLRPLREEAIYRIVELVIPAESAFIITYAHVLDTEKEQGMLEGKAGDEFRLLKWEFIFQLILHLPDGTFNRKQFAFSVLQQIGAHYNLGVKELLVYFYRSLVNDNLPVNSVIRELLIALYLDTIPMDVSGSAFIFPDNMIEILSNSGLCRLYLRPLSEEKIYKLVERVIFSESQFIIKYARTLEVEKDNGMLEGKAGTEFRILKWEFIFLVILSAPVTMFNRKQFVTSVLQQLSAHYNLTVVELVSFFYRSVVADDKNIPAEISEIIRMLYLDIMANESVERLTVRYQEEEMVRFQLEIFIVSGETASSVADLYACCLHLTRVNPQKLLLTLQQLKKEFDPLPKVHTQEAVRLFATLILFVIRSYGLCFVGSSMLIRLLEAIEEKRTTGNAMQLRLLLFYCITEQPDLFQQEVQRITGTVTGEIKMPEPDTQKRMNPVFMEKKEILLLLQSPADVIHEVWEKVAVDELNIRRFLKGDLTIQHLWLRRFASSSLRSVADEVFCLLQIAGGYFTESMLVEWLTELTAKQFVHFSRSGLLLCFWNKLISAFPQHSNLQLYNLLIKSADRVPEIVALARKCTEQKNELEMNEKSPIYISNAGLVLFSPYIPRLFSMLECVENKTFKNRECQIKGVFVLQRLLFDSGEYPELDLCLNKLLTGFETGEPLPRSYSFTKEEEALIVSLLDAVRQNWDKLRNTSIGGLRSSFLERKGVLEELEDKWMLTVESRAYDILLDSLPWSYSPVKFSWMEKPVFVKWR